MINQELKWKRNFLTIAIGQAVSLIGSSADLFMGFTAVLFALYFFIDTPPYWAACMFLGIRPIGNVFHTPAIQSIVPLWFFIIGIAIILFVFVNSIYMMGGNK